MKKSVLILFAAAAALAACTKPTTEPSSMQVKFAVENINTYTVKADLDPIGDGSSINICAGAPIASYNVAGTISGTAITGATINWTAEQVANDTPSDFWAIYPNITLGGDNKTLVQNYEIKSAEAVQYAGEVLCANATGKPSDANVKLSFKHPFAKVLFKVTNNITDDSVKEIAVTGFARVGDLDAKAGTVTNLSDNAEAITVVKKGTEGKVTTFETVVLPQEAAPVIVVIMNSGRTYTFTLTAAFDFKAGKIATAELAVDGSSHGGLNPASTPVTMAFEAVDWTAESSAITSFGTPTGAGETGWWYVRGTIGGESWGDFLPMAASGENTWTKTISYTPDVAADDDSKGIKIIYINGDTKDWYGSATVPVYGTDPFLFEDISTSGPNIKLGDAGTYKLSFYSDNHHMHVEKVD